MDMEELRNLAKAVFSPDEIITVNTFICPVYQIGKAKVKTLENKSMILKAEINEPGN